MKTFQFNYGIIAIDSRPDSEGRNPILHFCGYKNPPTAIDFDQLQEELSTNEEFNLIEIMPYIQLLEATPEIVELYKNLN